MQSKYVNNADPRRWIAIGLLALLCSPASAAGPSHWLNSVTESLAAVRRGTPASFRRQPALQAAYRHKSGRECPCPDCSRQRQQLQGDVTQSPSPSDAGSDDGPLSVTDDDSLDPGMTSAIQGALASYSGAASGPQGTPNMIGDAFGGLATGTSSFLVAGNAIPITLQFAPLGGNFGEANPVFGAATDPVQFNIVAENINGVAVPATTFSSVLLLNQFPSPINPGDRFTLDNGSQAYMTARAAAIASQFPNGGQTTFLNGEAEVNTDDGFLGISTLDEFFIRQFLEFRPFEVVEIPVPTPGLVVGRLKIAENNSPFPRDRVFFSHSLFDNVPLTNTGVNVNRFVPGIEKTFLDRTMSVEMRAPFAVGMDTTILADGVTNTSKAEFGDILLAWKTLLWSNNRFAVAGGVGATIPTANDVRVSMVNGSELIRIENESVRLLPYIAGHYARGRMFAQMFMQFDVAANGNPVLMNADGSGLANAGEIQDTPFVYFDASIGWWAYRCMDRRSLVSGIAPVLELHHNTSTSESDVVTSGAFRVGNHIENEEVTNLVLGAHAVLSTGTVVTMGFTTPLGGGLDQQFDGEFRLMLNQYFGRTRRAGIQSPYY